MTPASLLALSRSPPLEKLGPLSTGPPATGRRPPPPFWVRWNTGDSRENADGRSDRRRCFCREAVGGDGSSSPRRLSRITDGLEATAWARRELPTAAG